LLALLIWSNVVAAMLLLLPLHLLLQDWLLRVFHSRSNDNKERVSIPNDIDDKKIELTYIAVFLLRYCLSFAKKLTSLAYVPFKTMKATNYYFCRKHCSKLQPTVLDAQKNKVIQN
jgi:hypothetical protein